MMLVMAACLLLGATSCLDDNDNKNQILNYTASMYTRTVHNADSATFDGAGTCVFNLNVTEGQINVTPTVQVGQAAVTFSTGYLGLSRSGTNGAVYQFSCQTPAQGSASNIVGYLDLETMMLYLQFEANGKKVYSTSGLYYTGTTSSYDTTGSNRNEYTNSSSVYQFAISTDTDGKMSGKAAISNWGISSTTEYVMTLNNLNVQITADGYVLSSPEVTGTLSTTGAQHTMTNFSAVLSNQGRSMSVTYDCEGRHVSATGKLCNGEV